MYPNNQDMIQFHLLLYDEVRQGSPQGMGIPKTRVTWRQSRTQATTYLQHTLLNTALKSLLPGIDFRLPQPVLSIFFVSLLSPAYSRAPQVCTSSELGFSILALLGFMLAQLPKITVGNRSCYTKLCTNMK